MEVRFLVVQVVKFDVVSFLGKKKVIEFFLFGRFWSEIDVFV